MEVKMTEKEKVYKNKVIFLRKSKAGKHLYAFNNDDALREAESIIMNISDVEALIRGDFSSIKISIMEAKDELAESG